MGLKSKLLRRLKSHMIMASLPNLMKRRRKRREEVDQRMSRHTLPPSTYFGSCPVNPALSTRVNVNEHKTFHQLWMIQLRETKTTV